jgi:cobalt-zinc-cadmium efflux system outer membrane protein
MVHLTDERIGPRISVRSLAFLIACVSTVCCASSGGSVQKTVADDIRTATGAEARLEPAPAASVPAGVRLDDGLSRDEAVALALWNNAAFQVSVSQLGFARADLVDAGLIANPVLSLLFPVGPKQLEATLRLPAEVLWERPRRVAAAKLSLEVAAKSLVQSGLDLAFAVRTAFADLALALDRRALAVEASSALQRIDTLTQSRVAAGDIAELDARAARVDAARAAEEAQRAGHDVTIARERLRLLIGLAPDDRSLDTIESPGDASGCGAVPLLLERARAARPDLRAAELAVEAAAARLGWERSRILTLTAVLDANGEGKEGFEAGPGIDVSLPIFNRNQGGRLRAESELQRASAAYVQLQRQVNLDVREASTMFDQAQQSRVAWEGKLVTPLRANLADAETSYAAGEVSYLFVLENSRRLIEARVRARELAADEQRAQARIERAAGAACRPLTGGAQ